jgi:hypothetical protein
MCCKKSYCYNGIKIFKNKINIIYLRMIVAINQIPLKLKPVCINGIFITLGIGIYTVSFYYIYNNIKKNKYINFSLNYFKRYFRL